MMSLKGLGIDLSFKLHHTHTLHLPIPLFSSDQNLVPGDLDATITPMCQKCLSFLFSSVYGPGHMYLRSLNAGHNTMKRD